MNHVADRADHFDLLGFSLILQKSLELGRIVEVVFDGVLAASGDDNDVFDARSQTLLDHVLNQRLIDHGEHLFGLRFRSRQKSGAKTGGWKDGFAHASALLCHNWNPKLIPVWKNLNSKDTCLIGLNELVSSMKRRLPKDSARSLRVSLIAYATIRQRDNTSYGHPYPPYRIFLRRNLECARCRLAVT